MGFLRLDTEELLANVFSSTSLNNKFIVNYANLKELMEYLMGTLPGTLHSDLDEKAMERVAGKYPDFYKYTNGVVTKGAHTPSRRVFNQIYPTYLSHLISYSIDIYLLANYGKGAATMQSKTNGLGKHIHAAGKAYQKTANVAIQPTEYHIEVSMEPHPWDNPTEPYFWFIKKISQTGASNMGSGWAASPEKAWRAAKKYYDNYIAKDKE